MSTELSNDGNNTTPIDGETHPYVGPIAEILGKDPREITVTECADFLYGIGFRMYAEGESDGFPDYTITNIWVADIRQEYGDGVNTSYESIDDRFGLRGSSREVSIENGEDITMGLINLTAVNAADGNRETHEIEQAFHLQNPPEALRRFLSNRAVRKAWGATDCLAGLLQISRTPTDIPEDVIAEALSDFHLAVSGLASVVFHRGLVLRHPKIAALVLVQQYQYDPSEETFTPEFVSMVRDYYRESYEVFLEAVRGDRNPHDRINEKCRLLRGLGEEDLLKHLADKAYPHRDSNVYAWLAYLDALYGVEFEIDAVSQTAWPKEGNAALVPVPYRAMVDNQGKWFFAKEEILNELIEDAQARLDRAEEDAAKYRALLAQYQSVLEE